MGGPAEIVQGKLFIGLILNVMLFGINITQTYIYYIHSKKDPLWIKISVVLVIVADFIQPTFLSIYLYRTLVVNFGNETTLSLANILFASVPTMTALSASIVQIFFAWRIRILTKNWFYFAFIIACATSGGAFAIVAAHLGISNPHFVQFRAFKVMVILCFVSKMLGDIMITSILVWFLQIHKTGFRKTNKIVDRIIIFTVQTGLLTLIFASLDMVLYWTNPGDGTFLLLNLITSKLYSTSLLSSLNSRQGWGYDTTTSENNDEELDSSTDASVGGMTRRLASNSHSSTLDGTSVVITSSTPPISLQVNDFELENWRRQSEG